MSCRGVSAPMAPLVVSGALGDQGVRRALAKARPPGGAVRGAGPCTETAVTLTLQNCQAGSRLREFTSWASGVSTGVAFRLDANNVSETEPEMVDAMVADSHSTFSTGLVSSVCDQEEHLTRQELEADETGKPLARSVARVVNDIRIRSSYQ